jgi:hypothetical protein
MSQDHPALRPPPTLDELKSLPDSELVLRYKTGVENFDARAMSLSDAELDTAFFPEAQVGTWPCRVLLGHLADAELAFVFRMRKIAAEDGPVLEAWDENAFIDCQRMYGTPATGPRFPVGAFVATIHTLRQWTGVWLASLPPEAFARTGLHVERGEQSLRLILTYATWHLEHHAWYLNRKVQRLRGPA